MKNNILKISIIYKSLLSLLVLFLFGLGIFVHYVDPFTNYTALYQLFLIFTCVLFLGILFVILHVRTRIFKNLTFVQEISKHAFNSLVFASSATFFLLLVYTNSLSLVSFGVFVISLISYCIFEFLN